MTFITSIITSLVAIIVYLSSNKIANPRTSLVVKGLAILIGMIAAIASLFKTLVIITVGNVGVVELFGKVGERPLNPGIHLVNPFADVEEFSTRLRDIKETVEATSQEGLAFNIDVSVQYRLEPTKAIDVYKTIGTDETQIIISRFRSIIREITASYPAEAIYSTKRREVADQLQKRLSENLASLGFVVDETLLREIKLPEKLQAAVQQKLAVEQESEQMQFTLEKERQEAERKRIEAQGVADSQKIVSQGLNSQILQLRALEATEKLANSSNTKVVILGGGSGSSPVMLQLDSASLSNQAPTKKP